MKSYAVLKLDEMRIALPLECVVRIIRAVHITALPAAPDIVLGVVNVAGRVIPAVNLRRRFRLPERDIRLTDRLVIVRTSKREVAFMADNASGVFEYAEPDIVHAETILPGLEYIDGIMKFNDSLILIHNLERFLSLEEEVSLDQAIAMRAGG